MPKALGKDDENQPKWLIEKASILTSRSRTIFFFCGSTSSQEQAILRISLGGDEYHVPLGHLFPASAKRDDSVVIANNFGFRFVMPNVRPLSANEMRTSNNVSFENDDEYLVDVTLFPGDRSLFTSRRIQLNFGPDFDFSSKKFNNHLGLFQKNLHISPNAEYGGFLLQVYTDSSRNKFLECSPEIFNSPSCILRSLSKTQISSFIISFPTSELENWKSILDAADSLSAKWKR